MPATLAVVAITVIGIMVGVEFSVAFVINPITLRLPDAELITARAYGGRLLGRVMPFWYCGSMLLGGALTAVTWGTDSAMLAAVATGLLAISVAMSILLLVPINNRSKNWTADSHPDDWRTQQKSWDQWHYARLAVIIAGFVLIGVAVAML